MKEYSVNTIYLNEISKSGELKEFGQWMYYKSMFKKGCVFNYTDVHFSRRIGISVSSARLLKISWLKRGWCRIDGNNLIFNSARNSVQREKWHKTSVKIYNTLKQTIKELYYQVLYNKGKNQFDYLKCVSAATKNPTSNKEYKWGRKQKLAGVLPEAKDRFKMSYKGIGKFLGCSSGKAYEMMMEFLNDKKIRVYKREPVLLYKSQSAISLKVMARKSGGYVSRGSVYKNLCNEYVFN